MLSELAYHLAHAFTSGRKSAPAEFQEVQNQLYTLGGALDVLASDGPKDLSSSQVAVAEAAEGKADKQDEIIERMILNCRTTLQHLELLVDKYMEINPEAKGSGQTGLRKWREDMKRNWKKIKWTTEDGDLNKLRNNLAVHINGLNLALSAMHRCV
jgi:hypothetical protein